MDTKSVHRWHLFCLMILSLSVTSVAFGGGLEMGVEAGWFHPLSGEGYGDTQLFPGLKQQIALNHRWAIRLTERYIVWEKGWTATGTDAGASTRVSGETYARRFIPLLLSLLHRFQGPWHPYLGAGVGIYFVRTRLQEWQEGLTQTWSDRQTRFGVHLLAGLIPLQRAPWFSIEVGAEWVPLYEVRAGYGDGGKGGSLGVAAGIRF